MKEQCSLVNGIKNSNQGVFLCGDGRCDSHNAKHLTYTLADQCTDKIIFMSLTQVTEAGNSNRMEKLGLQKVLADANEKGVNINQITTDRHVQIRKYLREEKTTISHQFDIWHFTKNIRKHLTAASKKASCKELGKWIKSICNHLWWCCASCEGDEDLLKEKWLSIIFHVQNKHEWTGFERVHCCAHSPLTKDAEQRKLWLSPDTEPFKVLQSIVFKKTTLTDLKQLTCFSHTGSLEVYHSLYNNWLPKSHHFSYEGMVARSQLAAIDFNLGSGLEQAKTTEGESRYNVCFSKYTNTWTPKPIKVRKTRQEFAKLVERTIEVVERKTVLPTPAIPELPANISNVEKPSKSDAVRTHRSRFR